MYPPKYVVGNDEGEFDLRKFPLRHDSPLGWPKRYWPSKIGADTPKSNGGQAQLVEETLTFLQTDYFEFSHGDYDKVLLRRVHHWYDGVPTFETSRHYHLQGPSIPTWHVQAQSYKGSDSIIQQHAQGRSYNEFRWELSYNTVISARFNMHSVEGVPKNSWTLVLRDLTQDITNVLDPQHFEGIWILKEGANEAITTPQPHKPFTLVGWYPEFNETSITLSPKQT